MCLFRFECGNDGVQLIFFYFSESYARQYNINRFVYKCTRDLSLFQTKKLIIIKTDNPKLLSVTKNTKRLIILQTIYNYIGNSAITVESDCVLKIYFGCHKTVRDGTDKMALLRFNCR